MKKKIAFFLPSLEGGGAENVSINLANHLFNFGWDIEFVVINKKGPYFKKIAPGITVIDLKGDLSPYKKIFSLKAYVRYLKQNRPSVVISALHSCNLIASLVKFFFITKIKLIITIHSPLSQEYYASNSKLRKFSRFMMKIFMKLMFPYADRIIPVSHGIKKDLVEWIKLRSKKIFVIDAYPVIDDRFVEKKNKTVNHSWFVEKDFYLIVSIGRLNEPKDFETLLKSFRLLRNAVPVKLIILGEGKKRTKLELLVNELGIENDIQMPGFVDNPYVFLKEADLFVLSSRWEALPTVLMEALACGVTIVSTDCPYGPREILENGKYGYLVDVGNVEQLAYKMLYALRNPINQSLLLERARYYNARRVSRIYENLIKEVLNG